MSALLVFGHGGVAEPTSSRSSRNPVEPNGDA
jgi:hypothetical protein